VVREEKRGRHYSGLWMLVLSVAGWAMLFGIGKAVLALL